MKKLSEHFTLDELLESQTATRKGFVEQFTPPEYVVENLKMVCMNILEPLRKEIGLPIKISSGYRCGRVNKSVGGSKKSQHLIGQAVDLTVSGMNNFEIIAAIKKLKLPIDQVIEEFGRWVHVSHKSSDNRGQYLSAIKSGDETIYLSL